MAECNERGGPSQSWAPASGGRAIDGAPSAGGRDGRGSTPRRLNGLNYRCVYRTRLTTFVSIEVSEHHCHVLVCDASRRAHQAMQSNWRSQPMLVTLVARCPTSMTHRIGKCVWLSDASKAGRRGCSYVSVKHVVGCPLLHSHCVVPTNNR